MHKLTRIAYNSADWRRPTGEARQLEATGTYNQVNGFGHEDWLFRAEWQIDGWRYAFLQGVNKSHARLVRESKPFDVTLFTIDAKKTRRYVATIRDVECLSEQQATDALAAFKDRGWYKLMVSEIDEIDGEVSALGQWEWAKYILNIRFRQDQVLRHEMSSESLPGDWIKQYRRYQLYNFDAAEPQIAKALLHGRAPATSLPSTKPHSRKGSPAINCTPEHARMQIKLYESLKQEYPGATVECEPDFVDICVQTPSKTILFEIKSDLSPLRAIRNALGQILEYGFHPTRSYSTPVELIIVGRQALGPVEDNYMHILRSRFQIPVSYRVVAI